MIKTLGTYVRPRKVPILSNKNINKRYEFALRYEKKSFDNTIFVDESTFQLFNNYKKVFKEKGGETPTIKENRNKKKLIYLEEYPPKEQ